MFIPGARDTELAKVFDHLTIRAFKISKEFDRIRLRDFTVCSYFELAHNLICLSNNFNWFLMQ